MPEEKESIVVSSEKLDMDREEFRRAAHQMVDWICEYFDGPEKHPVLSRVKPGEIASQFGDRAPETGRAYEELASEFEEKVLPGITHWNHPGFMAYFAITGSQAGILGELMSAALNVNGMLWKTSPSVTELEIVVLDWLREALGLPKRFGIINDTASINSFLALAAAREAAGLRIREEGMTGRTLPQMRVYCSDQAHSSIEKGALALGFGVRGVTKIESDESFRMDVGSLRRAVEEDVRNGVKPTAVVATLGTTSTASVDPLLEIARIAREHSIWVHVDAAYAGSATVAPEFRFLWEGIDEADSIVVNPHKWFFTQVDCSVLYTKRPEVLKQTFSLVPEYLKTGEGETVTNFMDYGLQLGRRFRALKLWYVLEHYGLEKIRTVIRQHVSYGKRLAERLLQHGDVELLAPQMFSVVVFRKVVKRVDGSIDEERSEALTEQLMETINASGDLYVSHTKLRGRYGIRVAIGNGATEWKQIEKLLAMV